MKNVVILALFAFILPFTAAADVAATPETSVAPPTCKKPRPPSAVRRADDTSAFNESFAEYQQCIQAYVDEQNKLANLHVEAANKAVKDANEFVKEINEKIQQQ